jgi:hypothetical protein
MGNGPVIPLKHPAPDGARRKELHSAWLVFMRFCEELSHGEIEKIKIQDGLPVMAEVTRKKVRFTP